MERRLKLTSLILSFVIFCAPAWATDYCADANVVGCWPMDANESPVDDKTANGNDGTHNGTPTFATADPPDTGDGTASNYQTGYWELSGDTTDYFDFGSGASLDINGQTFSSTMWIYENVSGWKYWDNKYSTSPSKKGWLHGIQNSTTFEANFHNAGTTYSRNGANPGENQWEHFAVTLASDDTICVYLNGTGSCGVVSGASMSSSSGVSYTNGKEILRLCQLALFTDTLSSTEVNDIKDNGLGFVASSATYSGRGIGRGISRGVMR